MLTTRRAISGDEPPTQNRKPQWNVDKGLAAHQPTGELLQQTLRVPQSGFLWKLAIAGSAGQAEA
jgi:hypothetical protein